MKSVERRNQPNMPENEATETAQNYCQCASCCVIRTAIAHGTLQQPEVSSSDWLDALEAERRSLEQEARNAAPGTEPGMQALYDQLDGFDKAVSVIRRTVQFIAAESREKTE